MTNFPSVFCSYINAKSTIKKQHINDLVDWIEANLTNDINIDQITLKSGYSKWHMQRLFKEMTGQTWRPIPENDA
nr:hypothetical protein [Pantoea ananatis]